jgi:hypothetical protein
MTQASAVQEREAPAVAECRHHWLIESPHGATSWGMCKLCGARREFSNSASDAIWDGEGVLSARDSPGPLIKSVVEDEGF